jgi:hypothetical protein
MYKIINEAQILRVEDGALIPTDPANGDYQQYLEWLAAGGEPEPPDAPSKESRISILQEAYERDLAKLNNAWLSALIADGVGEVERQAVIKQQMTDLEMQLEQDILEIIMEE